MANSGEFICNLQIFVGKEKELYTKKVTLPFVPFVGLMLEPEVFVIEKVIWNYETKEFDILFKGSISKSDLGKSWISHNKTVLRKFLLKVGEACKERSEHFELKIGYFDDYGMFKILSEITVGQLQECLKHEKF